MKSSKQKLKEFWSTVTVETVQGKKFTHHSCTITWGVVGKLTVREHGVRETDYPGSSILRVTKS